MSDRLNTSEVCRPEDKVNKISLLTMRLQRITKEPPFFFDANDDASVPSLRFKMKVSFSFNGNPQLCVSNNDHGSKKEAKEECAEVALQLLEDLSKASI
jgi:hypothetical protein